MKNVAIVGVGSPAATLAAKAMSRMSDVVLIEPKESMQDQNAQPPKTIVVDDTQQPVDPELQVKPKRSCVHCQGRGYVCTNALTKQKIICRCVKKDFERVNKIKKERDAKLKAAKVTPNKGWDEPKAPVGNDFAPAVQ